MAIPPALDFRARFRCAIVPRASPGDSSMRLGISSAASALLFTALLAAVTIRAAGSAPTVKIDTGKLEGKSDGAITAFLGIPFGKPPVGDLRWKPPVKPAKWKGARKATEFGS